MNKTMMAVALVLLALSPVFAQVSVAGQILHYTYLFTVDSQTQERSVTDEESRFINGRDSGRYDYITFAATYCYRSDPLGARFGDNVYIYQGERNNVLVFYFRTFTRDGDMFEDYLYFSKDYTRLNYNWTNNHYQNIYRMRPGDETAKILAQAEIARNRRYQVYEQSDPPLGSRPLW